MTGRSSTAPDIAWLAEAKRNHTAARQQAASPATTPSAERASSPSDVVAGDVRRLVTMDLDGPAAMVLVLSTNLIGHHRVALLSPDTDFGTETDLYLAPHDTGLIYPLLAECDVYGHVWTLQIGRRVAGVDVAIVDAVLSVQAGEPDNVAERLFAGSATLSKADPRWDFKRGELLRLQSFTANCTRQLIDRDYSVLIDPSVLDASQTTTSESKATTEQFAVWLGSQARAGVDPDAAHNEPRCDDDVLEHLIALARLSEVARNDEVHRTERSIASLVAPGWLLAAVQSDEWYRDFHDAGQIDVIRLLNGYGAHSVSTMPDVRTAYAADEPDFRVSGDADDRGDMLKALYAASRFLRHGSTCVWWVGARRQAAANRVVATLLNTESGPVQCVYVPHGSQPPLATAAAETDTEADDSSAIGVGAGAGR